MALLTIAGCAADAPRSTRYLASDVLLFSGAITEALASDPFIASRTADSPAMHIVPDELRNISDERLDRADRWTIVAKVIAAPEVLELLRSKNIFVYLPPDRAPSAALAGLPAEVTLSQRPPATHALRATLRSAARAGSEEADAPADVRRDLFHVEYAIVDLETGRVEWTAAHEFARVAQGLLAD